MAKIFEQLSVYGFSRQDETIFLASILTGDPILLIGGTGATKTTLVWKLGKAIQRKTQVNNWSVGQFEDLFGFINPKKLSEGEVEYIRSPVTIWENEILGIDEVSRVLHENQNKSLEVLADGTVMGRPTGVIWRLGMMNPLSNDGTTSLTDAMLSRFASFMFVPELHNMSTSDRLAVIRNVTQSTAPALKVWGVDPAIVKDPADYASAGKHIVDVMKCAAKHYQFLIRENGDIPRFFEQFLRDLYKYLVSTKNKERISLDGRRAGYLYRHAVACRAIDLAMSDVLSLPGRTLFNVVQEAIISGLPIGVNSEVGRDMDLIAKVKDIISKLSPFLTEGKTTREMELQWELMHSKDVYRQLEILLTEPMDQIVRTTAWTHVLENSMASAGFVALLALNVEATRRGTIPSAVLDRLTKVLDKGQAIQRPIKITNPALLPFSGKLTKATAQKTVLGKIVAHHMLSMFIDKYQGLDVGAESVVTEFVHSVDDEVKKLVKLDEVTDRILKRRSLGTNLDLVSEPAI